MSFPIATTTARIDACKPCSKRRSCAMKLLGITVASDDPITYAQLLDVLGLDDALWCCRAEPDLAPLWRRYAVWCARQVQHLMADPRSVAALDVAERHAAGQASDDELSAAWSAAWSAAGSTQATSAATSAARSAAAWSAAWSAAGSTQATSAARSATAWSAARSAARHSAWASARAAQAAAFRQLVITGDLP